MFYVEIIDISETDTSNLDGIVIEKDLTTLFEYWRT